MTNTRLAAACLLALGGLCLPFDAGSRPVEDRTGVVETTIHEIQGNGQVSPLAGSEVVVEGIVTARSHFGYFIQSPDDATDGLPETSEALFVQQTGADNLLVATGDRVVVHGRVEEVLPGDYPHQLTVTQLVDVTGQFVLANGEALPAPIELDPADFSPDSDPTALERLEGMRVSAAELVVVGATQSVIRADNQVVLPNGNFHAVLGTSVANDVLPFREPGLPPFIAEPLPAGKSLPFNDGNPQVLAVEGSGQRGSIHADLEVGLNDRVRGAVGVLDYRGARHALLLDAQHPVEVVPGYRGEGAHFLAAGEVKLLWMDLGGLYDASDDPTRDEPVHSQTVYEARLAKIATGLCNFLANPEVIAVGGVENAQVLQDLAALVETNPTTYCPWPRQYEAVLVEGNDDSGLDLGFLVAGYVVDGLNPRVQVLAAETIAASETSANPDGSSEPLFTRPPLALSLRLTDEGGRQAGFTAVNLRLQDGVDSDSLNPSPFGWSTGGDRAMTLRARQAARIAAWIEDRQQADPNEAIAVLGGFEADAFNDGRVDVMGIVTGRPAPANETWVATPSPITTPLANLTQLAPAYTRYNANQSGEFRSLDHIVVNEAMRRQFAITSAHPRMNADFPASARAAGDPGFTFSARDPLMARLAVAAFIDANTRVQILSQGTFSPRVDNIFYVDVTNRGPQAAPTLELVIESSLAPAQWSLSTEWPGWTCGEVEAAAGGSRVACNNPSMIESHGFQIHVPADLSLDGGSATFTATLRGGHNDPDLSDNTSTRVFSFDGRVDLNVELLPINGVDDLFPGDSGGWVVIVNRSPLNPPGPVTITLDIDAVASDVTLNLSNGYVTCDAGVAIAPRRSRFTCTAVNDDFLQVAVFGLSFRTGLLDGGRVIGLSAEAQATGTDPTPADNVATASRRVSDKTDLVLSTPSPTLSFASLDDQPSVTFQVTNAIRGVARNARVEIEVDLPPSALGPAQASSFGAAPAIWSCLAAQADGSGSRITCITTAPFEQPAFPTYTYYFQVPMSVPLRAGLAQYEVTTRVTVASDSEEQVPANNTGQATFTVDQTSNLGIMFSGFLAPVVEPAQALFPLRIQYAGPNAARNPRARLDFNATLAPTDIVVTNLLGAPLACAPEAAEAGHTALLCPLPAGTARLTAAVRTHPALAVEGALTLTASVIHDLVDGNPNDNTVNGQVAISALADLCVGAGCVPTPNPPQYRLEPDRANTVEIPFLNRGPSTARDAVLIVEAVFPAERMSANVEGQACAAVDSGINGRVRLRCSLGDLPGDGMQRSLQVGFDLAGLVSSGTLLYVEIESAVPDPQGAGNSVLVNLPVVAVVDLSSRVSAKRARFPGPAEFWIEVGADGPPTPALSELVIRIESPGAADQANLWVGGAGWGCSPDILTPDLQQWLCPRYLPLDDMSAIRVEVPAHRFTQIGSTIRVTATHRYRPDALAVDRTPGNDSASAFHVVDGRSTNSVKQAKKPTAAYGAGRAATPAASRAPSARTATR